MCRFISENRRTQLSNDTNLTVQVTTIREFKKLLQRLQRERHKTIGFNDKHYFPARAFKIWYILRHTRPNNNVK